MKSNIKKIITIILTCIIAPLSILQAQTDYKIADSKDIDMKLSGTSTLHNWVMDAKTFTGEAEFVLTPGGEGHISSLKALNFSLIVQNLKSGEKGLDKNAYKALKTGQYKDIDYKLVSAIVGPLNGGKYLLKTTGDLSIAGITKEVNIDVYCVVNKDESITCTGSYKLTMTDYQVKPPTFMLGAMKTGDAITLNFTLVYKK